MTYELIQSIFMATPETPYPVPELPSSPARRLRDAVEPIATQGWWACEPSERVASLGLGFFDGYVWGRAASLGTPTPALVVATFGVFEPGLLTGVYEGAVAVASRDDVLAARADGAAEALEPFVSADDAAALADPLLVALDAVDGLGRPLFSALRSLPRPASPQGRLWRAAELVREHRGDGHLAAIVASGIGLREVNVLTELWLGFEVGEYSATRGLGPDQLAVAVATLEEQGLVADGALTDAGRSVRDEPRGGDRSIAASADRRAGPDHRADHRAGRRHPADLVPARSFPTDPRKRAAG